MNFELSDDQSSVLGALDQLLAPYSAAPVEPLAYAYAPALQAALAESGFLDIAQVDGFGPLDAALVVERVARSAQVVETAATALVAPLLDPVPSLPLALVIGDASGPIRFLGQARTLVVMRDDHAIVTDLSAMSVEPVESLMGYPYGRLASAKDLSGTRVENIQAIRRRWRIGLAAEAAGCMAAALSAILEHVNARFAFGRPIASFQAVQHRLAMAAETTESVKWLARRAAWSDDTANAAMAAGFAQMRIPTFTYDLHQFAGAMGLTLEFPLHWSRTRTCRGTCPP